MIMILTYHYLNHRRAIPSLVKIDELYCITWSTFVQLFLGGLWQLPLTKALLNHDID